MTGAADKAEIAQLMFAVFKRMQRVCEVELSEHGLSLSRAKILGTLDQFGPSNQSALATTFDLAPRTVTELVDVLERDGLVERRADPADRRARQVHLTPAGREAHLLAATTRIRVISQFFGSLNDDQLHEFAATLRQIDAEVQPVCAFSEKGAPASASRNC